MSCPHSALDAAARLERAGDCAECRSALLALLQQEPEKILALGAAEPPQPDWRGFNSRVRAGIDAEARRGWRGRLADLAALPRLRRAALFSAGALAASAVAALLLFSARRPAAPPAGLAQAPPAAGAPSGPLRTSPEGLPSPVDQPASATAKMLQLQIGDEDEVGDVVLILDEEIRL